MTIHELAARDVRKAECNLAAAEKRPNITEAELAHIRELCELRKQILNIITNQEVHHDVNKEV